MIYLKIFRGIWTWWSKPPKWQSIVILIFSLFCTPVTQYQITKYVEQLEKYSTHPSTIWSQYQELLTKLYDQVCKISFNINPFFNALIIIWKACKYDPYAQKLTHFLFDESGLLFNNI
jgi:hypothetical protein